MAQYQIRIITEHPLLTPERLSELRELAKKIDREEKDDIIALAREHFARSDRIKAAIAAIKARREAQGMTLDQLAAKTRIGREDLSHFEDDPASNPTIGTLLCVADAVGYEIRL